MVGHDIVLPKITSAPNLGEVRIKLHNLHAMGERGTPALRGVDLKAEAGEIVGVAGVSGNGQSELAEVIVNGKEMPANSQENCSDGHGLHPRRTNARRRGERFYRGKIMDILANQDAERGRVGLLMAGVRPE